MTKCQQLVSITLTLLVTSVQTVLAQTASPSATQSARAGGLPEAGTSNLTILITTIGVVLVITGAIKFFRSFR